MYHIDCGENSSLIKEIEYDETTQELHIWFHKYWTDYLCYVDFPLECFIMFSEAKSFGKFYLRCIKNIFFLKQNHVTMSETRKRPPTQNKASDQTRYIKMSIDVTKIRKDWLFDGEKGTHANLTLQLKPDGTVDAYGNLGMITQDVPKKVYGAEKNSKTKTQGPILGNGCEFVPKGQALQEGTPGTEGEQMLDEKKFDDLPF